MPSPPSPSDSAPSDPVFRRIARDASTRRVLADRSFSPGILQKHTWHDLHGTSLHVITEFLYRGQEVNDSVDRKASANTTWKPSAHQARSIESQAQTCHEVCSAACKGKIKLMEVFCPPRSAPVVEKLGFQILRLDVISPKLQTVSRSKMI